MRFVFPFLGLILVACSPNNNNNTATSSDGGAKDGLSSEGGPAKQGGYDSCSKILTCIGNCSDTDTACQQACYDKGSPSGQSKIDAFATCLDTNKCTDATCAKMYCASEIQACLNDVDGKADGGPPVTMGNVPAELVGDWNASNTTYHFDANGTYFMVGLLVSKGGCIAFDHIDFYENGIASATGNMLTTTATSNKQDTTDCSGTKTSKTYPGDTSTFTYTVQGTTLTMTGATGTITYQKQ